MQRAIAGLIKEELGISYSQALHSSETLINAFDPNYRIVFWNKKSENYFGVNKEVAIGRKLQDVVPYTANHPKMKYLEEAMKGEVISREKDKYQLRTTYYTQKILPVWKNGKVIGVLNIVSDIS